jgi:putative flippase GtrA
VKASPEKVLWLKFSAVGLVGMLVQLGVLAVLNQFKVHYLFATAIAVEAAVLHNYVWHRRWTWAGREVANGSLWRFHAGNGLLSILGNLIFMRIFTGWLHVPVLAANLMAVGLMTIVNFLVGDRWVFSSRRITE